jgi:hypothetical protein
MEAFNLIYQLNYIKNEIDFDLERIKLLQKDLRISYLIETNRELENRVGLLGEGIRRVEEKGKAEIESQRNRVDKGERIIEQKDEEIFRLKETVKELNGDNKIFEINLNKLKSNFFEFILFI